VSVQGGTRPDAHESRFFAQRFVACWRLIAQGFVAQ
jgi:hypothetical protein